MFTNHSTKMHTIDTPADTSSLQQCNESESSNLCAKDTIRHLREFVIPNLQERQKLQNEYWSKLLNNSKSEIESLKTHMVSQSEIIYKTSESYDERLIQSENMVCNLQKKIQLLENGVMRARAARREAKFHKKENKYLKAQLVESESWREFLGMSCYEHGVRCEEEYKKRSIVQEQLKEMEEKYELIRQNTPNDNKEETVSLNQEVNYTKEINDLSCTFRTFPEYFQDEPCLQVPETMIQGVYNDRDCENSWARAVTNMVLK